MLTPENAMKFGLVHPEPDRYDFADADYIVGFAEAHGMQVRGHNLVWHFQLPTWLTEGTWTRDELIDILHQHITTVVGHYRGRVAAWDVVNEAIADDGSLRDTIWLRGIGPEYIDMAFRWAHEADPDALLFYNDYAGEGLGAKSDAIYALVQGLLERGVPINGVGLQMHVSLRWSPQPQDVAANMERLGALGLRCTSPRWTWRFRARRDRRGEACRAGRPLPRDDGRVPGLQRLQGLHHLGLHRPALLDTPLHRQPGRAPALRRIVSPQAGLLCDHGRAGRSLSRKDGASASGGRSVRRPAVRAELKLRPYVR